MYSKCTTEADKPAYVNFITITDHHQQFYKGRELCPSLSKQITLVRRSPLPLLRWLCVCGDYKDIRGSACKENVKNNMAWELLQADLICAIASQGHA